MKKEQIQALQNISEYVKNTPKEQIKAELDALSKLGGSGPTLGQILEGFLDENVSKIIERHKRLKNYNFRMTYPSGHSHGDIWAEDEETAKDRLKLMIGLEHRDFVDIKLEEI